MLYPEEKRVRLQFDIVVEQLERTEKGESITLTEVSVRPIYRWNPTKPVIINSIVALNGKLTDVEKTERGWIVPIRSGESYRLLVFGKVPTQRGDVHFCVDATFPKAQKQKKVL